MKSYAVFTHPEKNEEHTLLVPLGFSWVGAILQYVWALLKGAWLTAFGLILLHLMVGFAYVLGLLPQDVAFIPFLAIFYYCGVSASDWWQDVLIRRGYKFTSVVYGSDRQHALLRLLEQA